MIPPPYLLGLRLLEERVPRPAVFPFDLPAVAGLNLQFESAVTFLIGENGSGKSTLIEALAELCGLPASGGGRNELASRTGPQDHSPLSTALRPSFRKRPRDTYFFRAEHSAHFAEVLAGRAADPEFMGNPYARYGWRPLHEQSHGEAFLALFTNRLSQGLYLMDEPESALSPQRQLSLLARMASLSRGLDTQFIIATHSPILLTFPNARILSLDDGPPTPVRLEDTTHYSITRGILECPERYWKHLDNVE